MNRGITRVVAVVGLLACVLGLSGCVAIKSITVSQDNPGGPVRFVVTLCANDEGEEEHAGCNFETNDGEDAGSLGDVQILLAVRAPAGSSVPATVPATPPEVGKELNFTRSPTYESELRNTLPAGDGFDWIGFISNVYDYSGGPPGTPARESTVTVDLSLPPGPGGGAFAGPLTYRWVTGYRSVGGEKGGTELPADRPVNCGEFPFTESGATFCIDFPDFETVLGPGDSFVTRDFGVSGQGGSADPGQAATLPFELSTGGPIGAGPTAALSVTTTLPGVAPVPSPGAVPLTDGLKQAVSVPVAVPAGMPPATYDVTLTAALPTGESRSATVPLAVRDIEDPVASGVRVVPKAFRPSAPSLAAAAGTRVSYSLSEDAAVRFTVERAVRRKGKRRFKKLKGSFSQPGAKAGANAIRFTGFLRNRALKRGRYRLVLVPTDGAGNGGKAARAAFRIRR